MKSRWYGLPLTLLTVLCLTLAGLPAAAFAHVTTATGSAAAAQGTSLGYSITGLELMEHDISLEDGRIVARPGGAIWLKLQIEGDAWYQQVEEDGVTVELVGEGNPYRHMDAWLSNNEDLVPNSVFAMIAIDSSQEFDNLDDLPFHISVRISREGEQLAEMGLEGVIRHRVLRVDSSTQQPVYIGDGAVVVAEEDLFDVQFDLLEYDQVLFGTDDHWGTVYPVLATASLSAGETFSAVAVWDTPQDFWGFEDWELSLGIQRTVKIQNVGHLPRDARFYLEYPQTMDVYVDVETETRSILTRVGTTGNSLRHPFVYNGGWDDFYFLATHAPDGDGTAVAPGAVGGSSSGKGSSGKGGSAGTTQDSERQTSSAASGTSASRSSNVSAGGEVSESHITAEVSQAAATGNAVTVHTRNATSIAPATLQAMTAAAQGKPLVLHADTLSTDGRTVQGRLYVEPAKLSGRTATLLLGVRTDAGSTAAVRWHFAAYFSNRVEVIHCAQQGGFGARLQIAARVDLSGLDTSNLVFYSYDSSGNTYARIPAPAYSVDSNGYLHFFTEQGGEILITDGPLTRK